MSANIKIIKWLTLITVIILMATCCVNINIETGIIVLDTILISNNMMMTLLGGICTGLVVVLAEKNYKYHLDKNTYKSYLYNTAMMLYSDFYYVHKNINELLCEKSMKIPKNLFTSRLSVMQNRLWGMANTDYCVFRKKDKFMLVHNNFVRDKFMQLKNRMDQYIYFEIAFTEAEINQLKNKMDQCKYLGIPFTEAEIDQFKKVENADENIYKVLKVLDTFTKESMETLDQYLCVLQNDSPKKFIWSHTKELIHSSYLGLYNSGNVNDFIKRNWNEDN